MRLPNINLERDYQMENYKMPTTDIEAFTLALRIAVEAPSNEMSIKVKADTRRLAQNKAKKINANYSFSGQFGNFIYSEDEVASHLLKEWEAA